MAAKMKIIAIISLIMTAICTVLFFITSSGLIFSAAITFGTIAYHFCMRLAVGTVLNLLLHNHIDYTKKWFSVSQTELNLYKKLNVKAWKGKMPTYDPDTFSRKTHSLDDIAQATCQAELVHEIIIVFSFLPILAAVPFGSLPVFLITSLLAACFDSVFVIMQRFNRPRLLALINREKQH